MYSFEQIIEQFNQNNVIAYPTEAVFGLGCNPHSEQAVQALLQLKNRPEDKGLILLASDPQFLLPYIDETKLTETEWNRFYQIGEQAITWIMPAKSTVSHYLTGKFDTIAVRLCKLFAISQLCNATQSAITSTSANLSGMPPCYTVEEVQQQFGEHFPILNASTGGKTKPSEIRDIFTQYIFRQG
ncbi:Sua5/YciO/YrdC/YwlC family protein [Phocoenobacter skyensis]|uniref:Threonylcarbamoyl-AMP synthase n=1 Tax=Phocoenobacter skyensis TaxID=97481 RepID=A0A1H7YIX0_9PAST|nr:Sua5/YciO/YrdC/YwlC family protein [Pasteurella skyensis]MDP8079822.1 Sua5/YciO/YrdC/YwlC family protein [Pasteurella skyensis]MDP8085952.1 Sua5/YciO/YrdC/YwlC family protein [Pasteurella skyensis]MDP8185689.1 Sua5/YciO/YrdC/YwlC family protein [Pasteurella skyensis]QLB22054.1 tRNA threonylcarbamoyladenosine biosynthesis protein RimN [Pasteurella skyensis]SEM45903.1 L-threonylcarbamoyladenylate synthase [Pasteurella skyensis]